MSVELKGPSRVSDLELSRASGLNRLRVELSGLRGLKGLSRVSEQTRLNGLSGLSGLSRLREQTRLSGLSGLRELNGLIAKFNKESLVLDKKGSLDDCDFGHREVQGVEASRAV